MDLNKYVTVALGTFLLTGLSACNSSDPIAGLKLGEDHVTGEPAPLPTTPPGGGGTSPPPTPSTPELGASCSSSDPNQYCLALKYVVYQSSSGTPIFSSEQILANLDTVNEIWSQCNIAFQIDDYAPTDPKAIGLNFNTSSSGELTSIRQKLVNSKTFLVVTTGTWSGSLGAGSANAWTVMPGSGTYGVVLEEPVGDYPNIIAHELGHYLNLDHSGTSTNVMSAIIYQNSSTLTQSQCNMARSAIQTYWKAMQR